MSLLKCIVNHISFQCITKTNFTQSYKIARVGPSLSGLLYLKPWTRSQTLGRVEGPRKLPGFSDDISGLCVTQV